MGLRAFLVAAVILGPAAPRPAIGSPFEEEPPPPASAGGVYRVPLAHENPSARSRRVSLRVRLSGRARDSYAARRNPSRDLSFRTAWSRRREEFGPGESRSVSFEFPVAADAPPILDAEAQVLARGAWRRFRGGVEVDDGAARRLRPAEAGGTPVPFRVLLAAHDRGGLPAGGSVARTAEEWDALRETMGLLSPVPWRLYPSVEDPGPWAWAFRGLPAYPEHHSPHPPDLERETVVALASTKVGILEPFWIRSVEERGDGVLVVRWTFVPCEPHYAGYILEPYCLGSDDTILLAVPRTDAPIAFERVVE